MTQPVDAVVQYLGLQGPPGPISATISSLASLATMPAIPAQAISGTLVAYTPAGAGPSTYYAWAPGSALTADGVAVVAGSGGNWLQVPIGSLSASVALAHGGMTTLSAAQAACPTIAFTDTGLTGGATVVLPTTSVPIDRTIDLTGVTFGGQTVTIEVGPATKTLAITTPSILRVRSDGVGKVYALTYA